MAKKHDTPVEPTPKAPETIRVVLLDNLAEDGRIIYHAGTVVRLYTKTATDLIECGRARKYEG